MLTAISPVAGLAGTALTINGSGLASCTTLSLGGAQVSSTATATTITATLPSAAPAGAITIYALCNGYQTNGVSFTVAPVPLISSVSPTSAYASQTTPVEINGTNFGSGTPVVTFNGTPVTSFSYLSPTVIVPFIPKGATTGSIVVTVGGISSVGTPYTIIQQPSITSIAPTSGTPGTPVNITGTNLSGCPDLVFGTAYYGVAPTATSISTLVQTGAAPAAGGAIQVNVICEGYESNSVAFNVLPAPPPVITSISPSAIYSASTGEVTVIGTNFGTAGTLTFTGAPLRTTSLPTGRHSK